MTEAELQRDVIDLAHLLGWRVAHFRSVPVKHGDRVVYETPVQADGAGFPDLVLTRDRVLWVELKSATGRLSTAQQDWMFALANANAECYVWHPNDWSDGTIEATLRKTAIGAQPIDHIERRMPSTPESEETRVSKSETLLDLLGFTDDDRAEMRRDLKAISDAERRAWIAAKDVYLD